MTEGQPIKTAPKDGSRIRLYFPREGQWLTGFWSDETIGDTLSEDADWYENEWDGHSMSFLFGPPTRWAPMERLEEP